jgi:glycosyltransferase involved in cell wall biosynthesis
VHGGAERHTITLANKLTERGHECHAAYVKNDPSQLGRYRGVASVQCLHAARYFDMAAVRELAELMRRTQPTSIVAANQYAMLYASLARRAAGLESPLVVVWHTTLLRTVKEQVQMLYYRPFFWNAECCVYVCDAQRQRWHARMVRSRRNEVIYNGVDTETWMPVEREESERVRASLGIAPTDYLIGLSAVLRPEKNHLQLVDAIAQLRQRGVPARALMIGDGPMRGAIEQRARELNVTEHVIITGFQQEVRPFLAACDTAVLTSFAEAFSLAAVEAMAMERPVIHTDVGGAPEMIRPGDEGYLYPVGDTAALVARLATLHDPQLRCRMGRTARETVEARFSERAMVDRYETLLSELEASKTTRAPIAAVAPAQ